MEYREFIELANTNTVIQHKKSKKLYKLKAMSRNWFYLILTDLDGKYKNWDPYYKNFEIYQNKPREIEWV